jgi:uncharacterized membrane protein YwzB
MIAALAGIAAAALACLIAYRLLFAAMIDDLAKAGETTRVALILAFVALVFGSGAYSFVFGLLDRGARRAGAPRS